MWFPLDPHLRQPQLQLQPQPKERFATQERPKGWRLAVGMGMLYM